MNTPEPEPAWRVGRKVGRTIYLHDQLVGLMDTQELAAVVVARCNRDREPEYTRLDMARAWREGYTQRPLYGDNYQGYPPVPNPYDDQPVHYGDHTIPGSVPDA